MKRVLPIAVLAAAIAAIAAGCGGPPDGLTSIRVCTPANYSDGSAQCKHDERGGSLVSSTFYCSAKVGNRKGRIATTRFYYGTQLMFQRALTITHDAGTIAAFTTSGGSQPLGGGPWRCTISLGTESLESAFASGGPTDIVMAPWVCATGHATVNQGANVCPQDEAARPIASGSVTCSALVQSQGKKAARVDLLRGGRKVISLPVGHVPDRVVPLGVKFTGAHGSNLPPGTYTCRFVFGGRSVLLKPFTVSG